MQIIINLLQILIRPTACPCTKFEVIWTSEHRVMGKRSWIIFCYVIWENGLVGVLHINVWRFSKLWTVVTLAFIGLSTWNLQRLSKTGLSTLCKNSVKKYETKNKSWRIRMTSYPCDRFEHVTPSYLLSLTLIYTRRGKFALGIFLLQLKNGWR